MNGALSAASSPSLPQPLSPSLPPAGRERGEQEVLQRRNRSLLFSLFSRRTGGRLGEEGRGDEGLGGAATGPATVALTQRRRTPPRDFRDTLSASAYRPDSA